MIDRAINRIGLFRFKTSLRLLQLFRRTLQHCFAVKLQKCFVDDKTSPDFPLAWGQVDSDSIYFLGRTVPLKRSTV